MKIFIVRHGQTDSNNYKKLLSRTDEPINDIGYMQCDSVKKILKDKNIDICFSSPLKRTVQTAKAILNKNIKIILDERLIERDFGELEGSKDQRYTNDFWDYFYNKNLYSVEPLQDLFLRTENFLKFIKNEYRGKTILIVSHAATIRAIHYNIVGFNKNTDMLSFRVENAKVLEYDIED